MRSVLVGIIVVCLAGCTALRPLEGPAPELRRELAAGALLKAGDRVRIVTADGRVHDLVVVRIANGEVVAKTESVPIDSVTSVAKREVSALPTTMLVGGIGLAVFASIVASAGSHHSHCTQQNWLCY